MNQMRQRQIFIDAMQFAIDDDEPATFLRLWLEGNWDSLKREWPEYPIPIELQKNVHRYSTRICADRHVTIHAYQYDFEGPGSIALLPVRDAASIVIESSEVESFLSIIARDAPLDSLLLENCQDDLVDESKNGAILISAEIPLFELRSRTFYWQQPGLPDNEAKLLQEMHMASAHWQSLGADMVQIVGYARSITSCSVAL